MGWVFSLVPCSSPVSLGCRQGTRSCCWAGLPRVWEDSVWNRLLWKASLVTGKKLAFGRKIRGCRNQETVQDGEEWQGSLLATLLFPFYIIMVFIHFGAWNKSLLKQKETKERRIFSNTRAVPDWPVWVSVLMPSQSLLWCRAISLTCCGLSANKHNQSRSSLNKLP